MKHFNTLLTVMFLLVWGGNIQSAKAQNSDIDWTQNAIDFRNAVNKNVYLYNKTHNGFLNAGGTYGMQAVLNPRGIRLTLRQNGEIYYFIIWKALLKTSQKTIKETASELLI